MPPSSGRRGFRVGPSASSPLSAPRLQVRDAGRDLPVPTWVGQRREARPAGAARSPRNGRGWTPSAAIRLPGNACARPRAAAARSSAGCPPCRPASSLTSERHRQCDWATLESRLPCGRKGAGAPRALGWLVADHVAGSGLGGVAGTRAPAAALRRRVILLGPLTAVRIQGRVAPAVPSLLHPAHRCPHEPSALPPFHGNHP